jgi:hypothetical protein
MIRFDGRHFWRGTDKIGILDDEFIRDRNGDKIGYHRDKYIFDMKHKIAYLDDDYICFLNSSHKIHIEDNNRDITGSELSIIEKAMARVLLGE